MKILIIDDEKQMRAEIMELLEYEGFEMLAAQDGRTGVALAKEQLPDLIICDVTMPGLNGYGVLFELRSEPLTAAIPFIFLTGRTTMSDVRTGMSLGADDYLTKPFTIDDLLSAIDTRLAKHAVVAEQAAKQLEDFRLNLSLSLPHELRTPLNGILGMADLLLQSSPNMFQTHQELIEVGNVLRESGLALQRHVENFLLYTKLRLSEQHPDHKTIWQVEESVPTKTVIGFLAARKAEKAQRKQDLQLDLVESELVISEQSLQKILMELLDNAFKFSLPDTPVQVATHADGERFTLSVTDQGRGMTQAQIVEFGAYVQFERRYFEQQGLGLGLSIVYLLAGLHGGTLAIHSQPDQGTTVSVAFKQNAAVHKHHEHLSQEIQAAQLRVSA